MARLPLALAALLLATVFAGCTGDDPPGSGTRSSWEAEAAAHAPMGHEATLDLAGPVLHVLGEGALHELRGPFTLWPEPDAFEPEVAFFVVKDAAIPGQPLGHLVIETVAAPEGERASLPVASGTLRDMAVRGGGAGPFATVRPMTGMEAPPVTELDPTGEAWSRIAPTRLVSARLDSWRLDEAQSVRLVTATGNVTLATPLTFSSASGFYWLAGAEDAIAGARAELDLDAFVLFGDVRSGAVEPRGRADLLAPRAVHGRGLELALTAEHAESLDAFQLTQAVTAAGDLYLDAAVEIEPTESEVRLARGETKWVALNVRETTYRGDAVLRDVRVSGAPLGMVEVPVAQPPLLIEEMWDLVLDVGRDAPWAAPFFAIGVAAMSPGLLLIDIFTAILCAFDTCPEQFPYPSWMDAGHVGVAYVKVTGTEPGTFSARIAFEGQNYDTVTAPLTVVVE